MSAADAALKEMLQFTVNTESSDDLAAWTAETLAGLQGSVFELRHGDAESVNLTLASVTVSSHLPADGGRQAFSLVFRTDGVNSHFPQGCRMLHHPALGTAEIFLVPIGPDGSGMCYEAVFN